MKKSGKYDVIKQLVSAISELPADSKVRIIEASIQYLETGMEPELDMVENTAFKCFKQRFDEVLENDRQLSRKRSASGRKGGRPRKRKREENGEEKPNESKKSNCFLTGNNEERKTERVEKEIFPPITPYKENPEREKETSLKGGKEKEPDGLFPPTQERKNAGRSPEELLEARKGKFRDEILSYSEKYPAYMLEAFFGYWSEKNKSKTQMRYELERTWELPRRLATWARNDKTFNKPQNKLSTVPREPVQYTRIEEIENY